jgi:hypothetical protein
MGYKSEKMAVCICHSIILTAIRQKNMQNCTIYFKRYQPNPDCLTGLVFAKTKVLLTY